uniref:Uncharacterized protein n=1 Tax=viral metagenome TaxID=1070528 RepID=A0A6C0H893_9ZZZZ
MYQYAYDATDICYYLINNNINNNILDDNYSYTMKENYKYVSNIEHLLLFLKNK